MSVCIGITFLLVYLEWKVNKKIKKVFKKMDKETQEAVKSLINHLMVAKTKKELNNE